MSKMFLLTVFLITLLSTKVLAYDTATWYGGKMFENKKMANGELYRGDRNTCASNRYSLGKVLKITNLKNKKTVVVTVTDRGSFNHRNVDLSVRAFETIARRSNGRVKVKIEVLSRPLKSTHYKKTYKRGRI